MRKLLMNCDQVFDVLTRGPFPTGDDSDESVEHHLRACHECRQLAEALQPAVELLHESLASEDAADLPEYQGVLAAVERSVATAEADQRRPLAVRRLVQPREERRSPLTLANFTQLAVVALLLVAVGSLTWNVMTTPNEQKGDLLGGVFSSSGPMTRGHLDDRGLMTLASLNLPARCFPQEALIDSASSGGAAVPPTAIQREALRCCTECHRAGQASHPSSRLVVAMHKSCVACHSL
jgi:hypothetical protein